MKQLLPFIAIASFLFITLMAMSPAAYAQNFALTGAEPGSAAPGTEITLQGSGFDATASDNTVTFTPAGGGTGTDATPSAISGTTRLTVAVPSGLSGGLYEISIERSSDNATTTLAGLISVITGNTDAEFTDISAGLTGVDASSSDWGDYDNDGDLDLVIVGSDINTTPIATIYRNDGSGSFTDISAGLAGVEFGSAKWGDYDGDGNLDLVIVGGDGTNPTATIYRNDGSGGFSSISAGLTGVNFGSSDWGDYDGDGDLDLLITGEDATVTLTATLYRNDGSGTFTAQSAGLAGVSNSSSSFGDYDGDGDLDLAITGNGNMGPSAVIYKNDGSGNFSDINAGLTGAGSGGLDWGDYDNDGDLDLVINGDDGAFNATATIYENGGSDTFTALGAGLAGTLDGSVEWGDYNADGNLDLVITGADAGLFPSAAIYQGNGSGGFTSISAGITGTGIGSTSWADYDNDGDLDLLITGGSTMGKSAVVYESTAPAPANNAPVVTSAVGSVTADEDAADGTFDLTTIFSDTEDNDADLTYSVESNDNTTLVTATVDNSTDQLTLAYQADQNGTANITIRATDNGGLTVDDAFTVTVSAVNDAPSITLGSDQSINEDAAAQSVSSWATGFDPGANESGQTISDYQVSSDNTALFSAQPDVDNSGTLTYTPANDAFGSATITVNVVDDGGTTNGGDDASVDQTFTITIDPVNDAPSFTTGPNQTVKEGAGAQTVNGWTTGFDPGANESGQSISDYLVSNDNTALFSVQPDVDNTGTLTYTPAADAFGSATVTINVVDDGGTANGGDDTSADQTFTITVDAVNDAPSITLGSDQSVNEDAGAQSVPSWASGFDPGLNESSQAISDFTVTNNNTALFSVQPDVDNTGTLTYTPAADAFGSATITVNVVDDGGTTNGGDDTSANQNVTITINPVNDAPTFTAGPDVSVDENAGEQTISGWATDISAGADNESSQQLTFSASPDNSALFAVNPTVDAANGNLTFTPATDVFGTTTVTIGLIDDGGTANGGSNLSEAKEFTITINEVLTVDPATAFTTTWTTNSAGETVTIPTSGATEITDFDAVIDWGDGNVEPVSGDDPDPSHTYTNAGTYTVMIEGTFPYMKPDADGDLSQLTTIEQWGSIAWESMRNSFAWARNMTYNATDAPDLSGVTDMAGMFFEAEKFDGDLSSWNTAEVTDMSFLFFGATAFNGNISDWVTSKVSNMQSMFHGATTFDGDISNWDLSSLTNMNSMFFGASAFNQDLSGWNTSTVTNMFGVFAEAGSFNQDISGWTVSQVTDMGGMFLNASSFDQDLSSWDISNVTRLDNDQFGFLQGTSFSQFNYDLLLQGWANLENIPSDLSLNVGDTKYGVSGAYRQQLIDEKGWTITDGGVTVRPFVTTWEVTTDNATVTIPVIGGADFSDYDVTIDWGDGTIEQITGDIPTIAHTYGTVPQSQTAQIRITGIFPHMGVSELSSSTTPQEKLISIDQWGDIAWESMRFSFTGAKNMTIQATDQPDLSSVTNMRGMFANAAAMNADLSAWDVSSVNDMALLFTSATTFNRDLRTWDVSSVTNMAGMFFNAAAFDQNIGMWDIRDVNSLGSTPSEADFNIPSTFPIFSLSGLSSSNYDSLLIGWSQQTPLPTALNLSVDTDVQYSLKASGARQKLINAGWTITDGGLNSNPFITTWTTTTANETITIPTGGGAEITDFDFIITWGDGTVETITGDDPDPSHTYSEAGTYTVNIEGIFPHMKADVDGDLAQLTSIEAWGGIAWESMRNSFAWARNMTYNASDAPDLSDVTDMAGMFFAAEKFDGDLSSWNTTGVTDMSFMFNGATVFDGDISTWDVSAVTNMGEMFQNATSFDGDVTGWVTSSATNMFGMFAGASSFNQDISGWDVGNVTDFGAMFVNAASFNQDLSGWNIAKATRLNNGQFGFLQGTSFSQPNYDKLLNGWASLTGVPSGLALNVGTTKYSSDAVMARQALIDDKGWTIVDGGKINEAPVFLELPSEISIAPGETDSLDIFAAISDDFTADSDLTYALSTRPAGTGSASVNTQNGYLIIEAPDSPALYYQKISVTDESGLTTTDSIFVRAFPLALTAAEPTSAAPGTKITLQGTGFDTTAAGDNTVTFTKFGATEGTQATPTAIEGTSQLTLTVPAGLSEGLYTISASRASDSKADTLAPLFAAVTGGGVFAGPQDTITTTAGSAFSVYSADLDGDGDLDVLSASNQDNKIAWYENNGHQSFGSPQVITTQADGASSVYAADLDADGDFDVLSASFRDNKIAWYENNGGGTFGEPQVITTSADGAQSVYAADLDGDGDLDVLSASAIDDKIAWYENNGNKTFGSQQVITTEANGANSVYAADLDGDGDLDVLSASSGDGKIAWYENNGEGAFGDPLDITTAADGARSVYAADLDADGDLDVLSASAGDSKIAWYKNNGDGTFSATRVITTEAEAALSVNAADLDADGDLDVLSASFSDNKIAWYENKTPPPLALTATEPTSAAPGTEITLQGTGFDAFAGDNTVTFTKFGATEGTDATPTAIDGTSQLTLTVPSGLSEGLYTISASRASDSKADTLAPLFAAVTGGGAFTGPQNAITTEADAARSVYTADLDGDGDLDVLSASSDDNKIAWYENNGGGTFGDPQAITTAADGARSVYAADLDGDGDLDVLSASFNGNKIAWYENNGSGTFGDPRVITTVLDGANSVYAADLDGDGDLDVLSASFNDNKIAWYENKGGTFGSQQVISKVAEGAFSVYAADLDADGDLDVLSASQLDNKIAWHKNNGDATFGDEQVISRKTNGARSVYAGDLDGDGDLDVLSASIADDKIAWYENNGGGTFGDPQVITTEAEGAESVYAADLDGDGDLDVLSASFSDDKIAWYENVGDKTFEAPQVITFSDVVVSVYAGDLDGDGDLDVLSASIGDDTIAWYENTTPSKFFLAENGVTIQCPDAAVGETGEVNGVTYTKRDRAGLQELKEADPDSPEFVTTCTSGVKDMSSLFEKDGGATFGLLVGTSFSQDISTWDVSSVTNMRRMFWGAISFNQDIGDWDVSNVTDMSEMFVFTGFNQDIGNWDVTSVTTMESMFELALKFNQFLTWDLSNGPNMKDMYLNAKCFNFGFQPKAEGCDPVPASKTNPEASAIEGIGDWNVSQVTNMAGIFQGAESFDQDISSWDVSNVNYFDAAPAEVNSQKAESESTESHSGANTGKKDEKKGKMGNRNNTALGTANTMNTKVDSIAGFLVGSGMSTENADKMFIGWKDKINENVESISIGDIELSEAGASAMREIRQTNNMDVTWGGQKDVEDEPIFFGLPDPFMIEFEATGTLPLWKFVEDPATPDSELGFQFSTIPQDRGDLGFDATTGELSFTAPAQPDSAGVDSSFSIVILATNSENIAAADTFKVEPATTVSTEFTPEIPEDYVLEQNYPNPFNPATIINFALPETGQIRLEVYNVLGRRVATLVNEKKAAGTHQVRFDGRGLASGMYIYRLQAADNVITRKMLLVK